MSSAMTSYSNSFRDEYEAREMRIKEWERTIMSRQVQMAPPQWSYRTDMDCDPCCAPKDDCQSVKSREEESKKEKLQNLIAYYFHSRK
jgi:hypothetical protein